MPIYDCDGGSGYSRLTMQKTFSSLLHQELVVVTGLFISSTIYQKSRCWARQYSSKVCGCIKLGEVSSMMR